MQNIILVPGLGMPAIGNDNPLYWETPAIQDFNEYPDVLTEWLAEFSGWWPRRGLHLVGFSLGADVIMKLAEEVDRSRICPIERITLLDPNLGLETMKLSHIFAQEESEFVKLNQVIQRATDLKELRQLIRYLDNLLPVPVVAKVARQAIHWWTEAGDRALIQRLTAVSDLCNTNLHVLLSKDYCHADINEVDCFIDSHPDLNHFDLIGDRLMDLIG